MKKYIKIVSSLFLLLLLSLFITSCVYTGEGSGVDLVALTKNPIVMLIVGGIVLYAAFKWSGKK